MEDLPHQDSKDSLETQIKALGLEVDETKVNTKSKFYYWFGTCFCEGTLEDAAKKWAANNADKWAAQKELCPTTGRPHMQYIVRWTRACTRGTKTKGGHKRRMGCDCFCTPVMGTQMTKVYHYCTKQRSRVEGTTAITHGFDGPSTAEIGWTELRLLIKEGKTWDEIYQKFPEIIKHRKQVLDEIDAHKAETKKEERREQVTVVVFHGPSHSGKTTDAGEYARRMAEKRNTKVLTLGSGDYSRFPKEYSGQKVVHFKEFKWSGIDRRRLLSWMEPGPATCDVMYRGIQPFEGEFLVFDTTDHPRTWYSKYYSHNPDKLEPELLRRIQFIEECKPIPMNLGRKRKREIDDEVAETLAEVKRARRDKLAALGHHEQVGEE